MNVEDFTIYWYEIHEIYQEIRRIAMDFTSEYWGFIQILKFSEVNPNQCMATMALETK